MFWVEIAGATILYLGLGIPVLRIVYEMANDKSIIKDLSVVFLILWPGALLLVGLAWFARLAFKWERRK